MKEWPFLAAASLVIGLLLTGCDLLERDEGITGRVALFAMGVTLDPANGHDLMPTEPVADASVVFFTDNGILGYTKTRGDGWTPEVSVTVPTDHRYDFLKTVLENEIVVPGAVHAVVFKDGMRPALVTGIPVVPNQIQAYSVNMWSDEAVRADDFIMPPGVPMTSAVPVLQTDAATKQVVELLRSSFEAERIPALDLNQEKGKF